VSETTLDQTQVPAEPPFRPIAHIGNPSLCGAPILGIKAFGDFDLCPVCRELNGGDPREFAQMRWWWQEYYDL
jgi:hypothetical protein